MGEDLYKAISRAVMGGEDGESHKACQRGAEVRLAASGNHAAGNRGRYHEGRREMESQ